METGEYETNTLFVSNIASVIFRVYEPSAEQSSSFHSVALQAEGALRDGGHIASYDNSRRGIWLFSIVKCDEANDVKLNSEATIDTSGYTLRLGEEGSFEPLSLQKSKTPINPAHTTPTSASSNSSAPDSVQRNAFASSSQPAGNAVLEQDATNESKTGQVTPQVAYGHFIHAVLACVSSAFCTQVNAIPLNYRTILIPANDGDVFAMSEPVLGTFRCYLTTTGTLVTSLSFLTCKSLSSLQDAIAARSLPCNGPIIAAPFGILATEQSHGNGNLNSITESVLAYTPNARVVGPRSVLDSRESTGKQPILKVLGLYGLDSLALKSSSWATLLVDKRMLHDSKTDVRRPQPVIPWPRPLCFRKKSVDVATTSRVGDTVLAGHDESYDPLGNARTWYNSATEREDKLVMRRAARQSTAAKDSMGNDIQQPKVNGSSPLALQRPNTAAAGAMYPTPPDAIQQQQQFGITPSLNGTISSPGNLPSTAAMTGIDSEMANSMTVPEGFPESWDSAHDPKRERSDSNLLENADNIFDDVSAGMFVDNENITEDDFNFFDAQPNGADLDSAMIDMPMVQQDPSPVLHQKAIELISEPIEIAKPIPPVEREDVVFAKPELKHARSVMNEEPQPKLERPGSVKRESSPFDPATVFKRVRASLSAPKDEVPSLSSPSRRNSIFEKVDFGPALPLINKKYEQGGVFDFRRGDSNEKPKPQAMQLPETEYLKRCGKTPKRTKEPPLPSALLVKPPPSSEAPNSNSSPAKLDGWISDVDDSGLESDQDDSSYMSEEPVSPIKSSLKRVNVDDDAMSQATSVRELEVVEESDQPVMFELSKFSKPEYPEFSLSRFFSDPEPLTLDTTLADDDLIQVAQLITEQAATGFLKIGHGSKSEEQGSLVDSKRQEVVVGRSSLQLLHSVIPPSLGEAHSIRLKGLLEIQDAPIPGQPSRVQPRPVPGRDPTAEQMRPNTLYQIPGPHLEVRRSESKLSVLPSAVTFWESLGLAPSAGSKDVSAICIFPGWAGMTDNISTFLTRFKSVYESLKLGTFERVPLSGEIEDGILSYDVDKISTSPDVTITGHGSTLIESMESLCGPISDMTVVEKNIVMFFVYSPENPGSIIEACAAFQRFFDTYRRLLSTKREAPQNDIVLQLVPIDFLSSPTSVVVPSPPEFAKLCMETYDRCTTFSGPMPAPAIMLEQPLPRHIDFKMINMPSASLMHENSCIHVAYAQSVDERWVSVAWTDNRGHQQATASYCMGRKGKPQSTSMNEVANEIWESTLELISVWKVHWRIIITKSGPMEPREMEFWTDLARTESQATIIMILLTVDANPSLQIIPPCSKVSQTMVSTFYSTPVSTPQPSILSPEQTTGPCTPMRDPNAPAATPGGESTGENDADASLTDITDQTWGAISGHRLSNSASLFEVRPALSSGYLIKRVSNKIEDPPAIMEVNLVHTDASPRMYEPLLREMISHLRGLGTLARARGVVEKETDVRPWHIAAAEKAARALYLLI